MTKELQSIQKEMRNIGPKCALLLLKVGIKTREQLQQLGTEEVFFKVWQATPTTSIHPCFLYAIEGAKEDLPWNGLSEKRKAELKAYAKALRESL